MSEAADTLKRMDGLHVITLVALALLAGVGVGFWLGGRTERARSLADQRARQQQTADERAAVTTQFAAAAADALDANNSRFLTLAEERLARAAEAQQTNLAQETKQVTDLVEPLTTALDAVAKQLASVEQGRVASHNALTEQIRSMREGSVELRQQTSQLVTALRASQTRGAWGETQLRRVVEAAGMLNRVDFDEQVRTADGVQRPDMVVHLAGGKHVVVDAKVTLLAFLDANAATDDVERQRHLAAHARQFRTHVDSLAAKEYWNQFSPTPEFVIMFVPAEPIFAAAVESDPTLFEYAFDKQVVIATPMTLLAILRTVAYAWRQEALAENAQQVLDVGKELHARLATMGNHLTGLGQAIRRAADAYNATVGALESRVFVSARRFAELGVVDTPVAELQPVEINVRNLSAGELLTEDP